MDLAKEIYFRELDDKAQLDARLGPFVAILFAVGGLVVFLVRSAWPAPSPWSVACLVLSGIAVALFSLATFHVVRAMLGFSWARLPHSETLLEHYGKLVCYYAENPTVPGSADDDFEAYLLHHLASTASRNGTNNLVRSARFYRALGYLVAVIITAALAGFCLGTDLLLTAIR